MEDVHKIFADAPRSSMMGTRVASLADLPPKKVLVAYVAKTRRLDDEGRKEPRPARFRRTIRVGGACARPCPGSPRESGTTGSTSGHPGPVRGTT